MNPYLTVFSRNPLLRYGCHETQGFKGFFALPCGKVPFDIRRWARQQPRLVTEEDFTNVFSDTFSQVNR
jgi:hypothetical protein